MRRVVKDKPSYDKPNTIIGEDAVLESARMVSKSSVQISGQFIGDIEVKASLVVGLGGKVTGNILANFVLIAGEVEGDLEVHQQIHLTKTAKVLGDIVCQSIVMDEGAYLEGQCMMKGSNGQDHGSDKANSHSSINM